MGQGTRWTNHPRKTCEKYDQSNSLQGQIKFLNSGKISFLIVEKLSLAGRLSNLKKLSVTILPKQFTATDLVKQLMKLTHALLSKNSLISIFKVQYVCKGY